MCSTRVIPRLLRASVPAFWLAGCAISPQISQRDADWIAGKTFVVTGASSGFGKGVALELARHRANIVLAARRSDVLEQVAEEVRAKGGMPLVVPTDVGLAPDVRRLAEAAVGRFGRVDVWINNAGVLALGRFENIPMEDHSRLVDTNLKGVIYGSHSAIQRFRTQGHGTLVNIASIESEVPLAYQASYAATKAAVLSLGRALNEEIRLSGQRDIKVATVMPWAADTPLTTHAANYTGRAPRLIGMDNPEQVVNAIVWVSVHPQEELPVGWKSRGTYVLHHVFPDTTESISADLQQKVQITDAPRAPNTSGSLHAPLPAGRGIYGGNVDTNPPRDATVEQAR